MIKENIAAIATPPGVGGISIIRISGPCCIAACNKYLKYPILHQGANTIKYNKFVFEDEVIDEMLVSVFKAPKSFTGEDCVELNCHGGIYITNKILEIIIQDDNIAMAQPGEFSKRAFLNGKKNLVEVESIVSKIEAKTESEYNLTKDSVVEKTTAQLTSIYQDLMEIITSIEVKLDYPEYQDLHEVIGSDIVQTLFNIKENINKYIQDSNKGQIISTGVKTIIVGAPNVGKSSLLNALSKTDKAIVSDIQGTTRDVVESEVNLGRIKLHLLDTAGIRQTDEQIEKIGVQKSLDLINQAELILFLIDQNVGLNEELLNVYEKIKQKPHLILINKCDDEKIKSYGLDNELCISVKTGFNIDSIEERILEIFNLKDFNPTDKVILNNTWQIAQLKQVYTAINSAIDNINMDLEIDIVEIDLKQALYFIGEILGVNVQDNILDSLFSNYCLGK